MNTPRPGRTIVVGVDGSEPARRAVRWAAQEAVRRGLPLRVVTAFEWMKGGLIGQVGRGESYRGVMLGVARGQLAEAVRFAEQEQPALEVQSQLVVGFPIPVLTAEAQRAALVVLGNRGLGGVTGLLVGSVAVALAADSECPVVVVRGEAGTPDPAAPVVVGVDGSPTSEAALAFAFEAAAVRKVPLVAVHTWWDPLLDATMAPATALMLDWDAIEVDERALLAERLAGWGEKYPDVRVRRLVMREHPSHALVEQSGQAQLVVVGSRGRGAMAGLVLGSVSHAVLQRAHCPVAVVRPEPDAG
jgi:nucleotide-binding universal stress UspA family protein